MAKGQRKQAQEKINMEQFESLCSFQCTKDEIASFFKVGHETLQRWCKNTYGKGFEDVFKEKSANGKAALRRIQFNLAKTNAGMAIWLGKQYLGQKDDINPSQNASEDDPLSKAIKEGLKNDKQ